MFYLVWIWRHLQFSLRCAIQSQQQKNGDVKDQILSQIYQILLWANNGNTVYFGFFLFKAEILHCRIHHCRLIGSRVQAPLWWTDWLQALLWTGNLEEVGQRTLKMKTGWVRNTGGQHPDWVSRNYTAILWVITEHFTPMLSDLKNPTQNKMHRDTFPTKPHCSFSKAIKCPFLSVKVRASPSLLEINTLVHIPSFYTVYISTWHCKLLQDDSVCYWLTAHFKSFLCASIQLCLYQSGILTPSVSYNFALKCTRQILTQ